MMTIGDRGPGARAERVRFAYYGGPAEEEGDGGWERPGGGGILRFLAVVVLLHVVGIGGVLGYRWLHRDGKKTETSGLVATQVERPPVEELVPAPRTNGKAIVVDHPTLKGHVRYRVGKDEELIAVARRFNASVAEVEKLNSLRLGTPLYSGQWLTVPDHRERLADGTVVEPPTVEETAETAAGNPLAAVEAVRPKVIGAPPEAPKVLAPKPEPLRPVPVITPPVPAPGAPAVAGQTYRVANGDTAYRIALKYGITWQELLQHNGMTDPRQLQAGQVLKIPPKR